MIFRGALNTFYNNIFRCHPAVIAKRSIYDTQASTINMKTGFPHFEHVAGWLMKEALLFTSHYVSSHLSHINDFDSIEIGVHHGKFAIGIENLTPLHSRCLAVDLFSLQQFNIDSSGEGDKAIFMENAQKYALAPERIKILEMDSMNLDSHSLGLNRFGIVSIDGGHTRTHTFQDLKIAQDIVSSDGMVILDDILNQDWTGVVTGALDFFNSPISTRIAPFAIGFNKLFICHASVLEQRRASLYQAVKSLSAIGIQPTKDTPFGHHMLVSLKGNS